MTDLARSTGPSVLRTVWRGFLGFLFIAFLVLSANASLVSRLHFMDVRLPMLLFGAVAAAPGWLLLALAARTRGAPWRWLVVAAAWGAFAAAFLAYYVEELLGPLGRLLVSALAPLGQAVAVEAPGALIAPIVEEPAKAIGILIVLVGVRRAGIALTLALGAAIGGLVGVAFGVAEASHQIAEVVANIGYVDLNGVFIIDWPWVWHLAELQLVQRMALAGLTDHALFSALAGIAVVQLLRRRRVAAAGWFVAALVAHALFNTVGGAAGALVYGAFDEQSGPLEQLHVPLVVVAWVAAAFGFLVAEGWAVVLLVRQLRRGDPANPAGTPISS